MPNPVITVLALREYRRNYTRRGVLMVIRRRWKDLLFHPREQLDRATALSEGVFS